MVLRFPSHPWTRPPRKRGAFTLVELLVVIGIIALLISILLPALSSARRRANSVKCLANLRSLGHAFLLYENESKGFWPPAVHRYDGRIPLPSGTEVRWPDLLAKHIASVRNLPYDQLDKLRDRSVIWGCPEWYNSSSRTGSSTAFADKVRVGYGMQYYPTYFEDKNPVNMANIGPGSYVKATKWRTRGAERALIADSITHVLVTPDTFSKTTTQWQPFDGDYIASESFFAIDATRHAKTGTSKRDSTKTAGINVLFCDGHASTLTVVEAWNAIHNPGEDRSKP